MLHFDLFFTLVNSLNIWIYSYMVSLCTKILQRNCFKYIKLTTVSTRKFCFIQFWLLLVCMIKRVCNWTFTLVFGHFCGAWFASKILRERRYDWARMNKIASRLKQLYIHRTKSVLFLLYLTTSSVESLISRAVQASLVWWIKELSCTSW